MMQNVLSQIVPSLIWVEEFQYCLQNQVGDFVHYYIWIKRKKNDILWL